MVRRNMYIPDRGDVVWVSLDPVLGHEQSGRRPILVLSPSSYNEKAGLIFAVPITSKIKGYPFEVLFQIKEVSGAILADQARAIDWKARKARKIGEVPAGVILSVQEKISSLIFD
ncbi:MAG: hypothetical protein COV07_02910 [Candidatus Vogelbacteria bacterium CG10_big_fil_rev_8_21_14_0_10_45_14]|uniref:mRNA interferase n=1 Tax=Candidatus Vogelbacteria bacterium CG10_big_fil_rev_8_21_14_0_10_45_14 TaxID=1975042 RepID=A0A2H0RLP5_9BACT|nr:MAG: hypothetical protein COV07_02910 [Candidatus Vogelbacteria bacterium CG10_big_fil_rev_8_21_14_0_10_45_14]